MKRVIYILSALIVACVSSDISEARKLRVAFVGDPQVDNMQEMDYARKSIYSELRQRNDLDLVVLLGDLVDDDPSLLSGTIQTLDSLSCPWASVPGNHDRDFYRGTGRKRDLATWRKVIGAPDTTFSMGNIQFLLMNNVRHSDRGEYEGGFTEKQKSYIASVLENTPKKAKIILATHIPVSYSAGRDSILNLLSAHPDVLLVSGHTHTVRRSAISHDERRFDEIVAGASCGTWWRGKKDSYGIPYALQNCGAPRGYFIADFGRNGYELSYKCVGLPSDEVASAWIIASEEDSPELKLMVNVYGGSIGGELHIKTGGKWIRMEQSRDIAPEVLKELATGDTMTKEERREARLSGELIPLRRTGSTHVWSVEISDDLALENIRIRYRDPYMSIKKKLEVRRLLK